jgi:hypothetical protein
MSNFTQIPTASVATRGLFIFVLFSIFIVLGIGFLLFLKYTSCYIYIKYWLLQCYRKCCCSSPFYNQHILEEAEELQDMIQNSSTPSSSSSAP